MPRQERTKSGTGIYHVKMITEPSPGHFKMASKACKATEEEWQSLNQFAIKNMPAFLDKICDEEKHLTEKEIKVCILTRLQFIPTEMAVLLDLSRQRITNVKANANKKLFDEAGAQTFDSNIHRL